MRVIAGAHGGRPLVAPRGRATRPTSDRVREAVFSILGDVAGAEVLDLYAGTGAMAIEALSRGAGSATFVDSSSAAIASIRRNLASLGLQGQVRREDVRAFLRTASRSSPQYDLVFLDPPYQQSSELAVQLSATLEPMLAPGARVVAESDRRAPLKLDLPLLDERRYGDTLILIHGPR